MWPTWLAGQRGRPSSRTNRGNTLFFSVLHDELQVTGVNKPRILFVQPSLNPPGGGNGVAAWMLEALKESYRITLLSWHAPDFDAMNRYFGTALTNTDIEVRLTSPLLRSLTKLSPTPMALLKHNYLMRYYKKLQGNFDIVMTADNEVDFGRRGIQYVHFPRMYTDRPKVDLRWYHLSPLVNVYRRFCFQMNGVSGERISKNRTLVNSDYIGRLYRSAYANEPQTLYPPAIGKFPDVSWEIRENGFVTVGRISPEKRYEQAIRILSGVRDAGFPVHLHIVGSPDDSKYTKFIRGLVKQNSSWVTLDENISRDKLCGIIATHRYGIHSMPDEHFGMAVAEFTCGGCIPFVPNGGGQIEIVDHNERLIYGSVEDAITKIILVLRDDELQGELIAELQHNKRLLSTEHFAEEIRTTVRRFATANLQPDAVRS